MVAADGGVLEGFLYFGDEVSDCVCAIDEESEGAKLALKEGGGGYWVWKARKQVSSMPRDVVGISES